jgi:hypothetical protein
MATLVYSVLFGSIGVGYFIYGKKQQKLVPWIAGMGLCTFPYVVDGSTAMLLTGIALTIAPVFLRQ